MQQVSARGKHCCDVTVICNDTWRSIFNAMWRISPLASLRFPGNGAVYRWAGDGEEFRQIADRVLAGLVHPVWSNYLNSPFYRQLRTHLSMLLALHSCM